MKKTNLYNTTIYNTYKSESERKEIAKFSNLEFSNIGYVICFEVEYRGNVFRVSSSQMNNRQIGVCVSLRNGDTINFAETVDVRSQSINNLVFAMDELIKRFSMGVR